MEKQWPKLEPAEMSQLRILGGGAVALVAIVPGVAIEGATRLWACFASLWILYVLLRPQLALRWRRATRMTILPACAALLACEVHAESGLLEALVRLMILLVWYRAINFRYASADKQLAVAGFVLVVLLGVQMESPVFALHLAVYLAISLLLLLCPSADSGTRSPFPNHSYGRIFRKIGVVMGWRIGLAGGGLLAATIGVTFLLFVAIPRVEPATRLDRSTIARQKYVAGFSDTIKLGGIISIQQDDGVAFRVDSSEPATGEVYWRMVVLDGYRGGSFRMTPALRVAEFGPSMPLRKIVFDEAGNDGVKSTSTFYLEPGVGRYLPLPESVAQLDMATSLEGRTSDELRLVELSKETGSMLPYRVVADSKYVAGYGAGLPATMELAERDREKLKQMIGEIRGALDGPETAIGFAHAAALWLGQHHGYSLNVDLHSDGSDPVVGWAMSRESGHCELFAGALMLLVNEAGYDARVVGGFVGGERNGDYLVVRNSRAHAWCEVFDTLADRWVRIDPTLEAASQRQTTSAPLANVNAMTSGLEAWVDRMQMFWYRHVVSFEDEAQLALLHEIKEAVVHVYSMAKQIGRNGLRHPWVVVGIGLIVVVLVGAWRSAARGWWITLRIRGRNGEILARREAARWLRQMEERAIHDEHVRNGLVRVRFGPRGTWPNLGVLWREAHAGTKVRK